LPLPMAVMAPISVMTTRCDMGSICYGVLNPRSVPDTS
jgi:hypothetical protein